MTRLPIFITLATLSLCTLAASSVVSDLPVEPRATHADLKAAALRRMRASIRRDLANMQQAGGSSGRNAIGMHIVSRHDSEAKTAWDDGFTAHVNDGIAPFRPIRPGSRVPSARETANKKQPTASDEPSEGGKLPGSDLPGASPEPSPEGDDGVCFPASATVQVDDGSIRKMADLRIGDRVLVGHEMYSPVFMFTHRMATVHAQFVRLHTRSGHTLQLTRSHYVYVNDRLAAAATVRVGDSLTLADASASPVDGIDHVSATGLYNPQTLHGDIVVNGVRASTYTMAVEPKVAHALLTPLRTLYERAGLALTCFDKGADRLANWLPHGAATAATTSSL